MEKFEIKSQNLTTQYEYENESVTVAGNYKSDKQETTVSGIDGQVFATAEGNGRGAYIGNFTGTVDGEGEMEYSLSKMTRRNTNLVWDAIDGIEGNVLPSGEAEGTAAGEGQEGGEE